MIKRIIESEISGFTWLDVIDPTKGEIKDLVSIYNLDESSVIDCLQPEHLPKFEIIEDLTFIMLRIYDPNSGDEADTIQELSRKIAIFYIGDTVITIHRSELQIISDLCKSSSLSRKCTSPEFTIFHIVNKCLQTYDGPAHKLLRDLDKYESDIFFKNKIPNVLKLLYHLKRKAAVNDRILNLSTDIIDHMDNLNLPDTLIQDLRDMYVRMDAMYNEVQEGVNNLLNIYISLSSQKTNEVVRVLTVFSVFFMPLTFVVGIYGMNFQYMPELKMQLGYPGVMALMAIITGGIYAWFRKKGWL